MNYIRNFKVLSSILLLTLLMSISTIAGEPWGNSQKGLRKIATNDVTGTFLINNIFNYYSNTGDGSYNTIIGDGAFEFPKGSGGIAMFEDGFVWGCFQNGVKKVGGSTYDRGLQAGKILTYGTAIDDPVADNPGGANYRLYRVRPDINPSTPYASVRSKLNDEELVYLSRFEGSTTTQSLYDKYILDWLEWPAGDGAPYTDVDSNGVYDPTIDIPGLPGADQTLWHVCNDMDASRTAVLYGSTPIGIEMQRTIWGYKRTGALGNTVFVMYKIINKSGKTLDSMFVSQWADPDLGGALGYTDDYTGCDTARSLGYVFNGRARDGFYGDRPPAVGFDFFQGPLVVGSPSDVAVFGLKYRPGYKNLGMSSFNFFINSNDTYADPRLNDPRGTDEWYNLMNGTIGRTGGTYINPTTGLPTKFVLSGDPVAGKGWYEGSPTSSIAAPGDRRMALCAGPFTMAPGDTQEVVVAALCGQGSDRLSSISVLRFYSDQAQAAYNALFDLASPPAAPVVTTSTLDDEIILKWSGLTSSANTENPISKGYQFQGYNVYQYPTASATDGVLLATFDRIDGVGKVYDDELDVSLGVVVNKPVQFGNDNAVQRFYQLKEDKIRSGKLINGRSYYFAITAYSYNMTGVPKTLESQPQVIEVRPQMPNPGDAVASEYGNMVALDSTKTGVNDGSIVARVVDPNVLTGHTYKIYFTGSGASKRWCLADTTAGDTLLTNMSIWGDSTACPVVDGIQWAVNDPGALGGFKQAILIKDGGADLSPAPNVMRYYSPDGTWAMDGLSSTGRANAFVRIGASLEGADDYEIRITDTLGGSGGSQYYDAGFQMLAGDPVAPGRIPMEAWNITKNQRLIICVRDVDGDHFGIDHLEANSVFRNYAFDPVDGWALEWDALYVQDPASAGTYTEPLPDPATANSAGYALRRLAFFSMDTSLTNPKFPVPVGTVIRFLTNKPILNTESWVIRTANIGATKNNIALAKSEVEKINVWPNPYFGFNLDELNKYNRFITFSHLPRKATIRIFSLAGVLVRTLVKESETQFLRWNMLNSANLPIAAGLYIAHIDMPDLGKVKVLKFTIIPETQILDKY